MSSRNRALHILELLARHPLGLPTRTIAERLGIPRAAAGRLVEGLARSSYVQQDADTGLARLRMRLPALALAYLGASGITDLVQPILDDLAARTGELVRLAVVEGDRLTWVGKAQGPRSGLFYSPDAGTDVHLPSTANGRAWLSCLDADAVSRLIKLGEGRGPGRPKGKRPSGSLEAELAAARARGYALVSEAYQAGTTAMAAAIRARGSGMPIGTVSVAGPTVRMTEGRVAVVAPWLLAAADELGAAASASPLFATERT